MSRTVSKSNALSTLCAVAFLGICAVLVLSSGRVILHQTSTKSATAPSGVPNLLAAPAGPTLIVYILSFADSSYLENFQFFYREAILRDPDSRYDVLVAEDDFQDLPLPPLPPHARYVRHGRGWCGGLALAMVKWHAALGRVPPLLRATSSRRSTRSCWVRWSRTSCCGRVSPLADHANDGHSLSPYEALFVPLGRWDDAGQPYGSPAELAAAYSEWMALPAVLFAVALGEQCFDADHFKQVNPDMAILPNRDLWKFWVFVGQFQPRGFRLRCGMDWSRGAAPLLEGGQERWGLSYAYGPALQMRLCSSWARQQADCVSRRQPGAECRCTASSRADRVTQNVASRACIFQG
eukprot:XP_001695254.1 predicted protein [Chlamydomonas reinhardtii]